MLHLSGTQHLTSTLRAPDIEITFDARLRTRRTQRATCSTWLLRWSATAGGPQVDSDVEDEPDDSIFEDQLQGYDVDSEEYEEKKEE